ncbi:MAG: TIGR04563 family protein [Myxococcota bacterium]
MSGGVKQSLYFPEDMLAEIQREAQRLDRSVSWIVQQAWKIGREDLRRVPSANDVIPDRKPPGDSSK